MMVGQFLLWARQAAPSDRAEAVTALARAYLFMDLSPDDRREAETAMTAMLDDGSVLVRRAMAEVLGSAAGAPRHLLLALAGDVPEIAVPVLARSPILSDSDLVDAAAVSEELMQMAIASRRRVSAAVAAALCEVGTPGALVRLARNPGAEITDTSLLRMVERHGSHPSLREALLARGDLPVEIAQAVASALASSLASFVTECGWLSVERSGRATAEACERTTVALAGQADDDGSTRLVEHLRRNGELTSALVLRAILSGNMAFADAAFSDLSGMSRRRAGAILRDRRSDAFRSLYGRAGMPAALYPAFDVARRAALDTDRAPGEPVHGTGLSRRTVERALVLCERLPPEEAGRFVGLLRRFEVEAARDEARLAASGLADRAALAFLEKHMPEMLESRPDAVEDDPEDRLVA